MEDARGNKSRKRSGKHVAGVQDSDACSNLLAVVEDGEDVYGARVDCQVPILAIEVLRDNGFENHIHGASVTPKKKRVRSNPVKLLDRAVRALTTAQSIIIMPCLADKVSTTKIRGIAAANGHVNVGPRMTYHISRGTGSSQEHVGRNLAQNVTASLCQYVRHNTTWGLEERAAYPTKRMETHVWYSGQPNRVSMGVFSTNEEAMAPPGERGKGGTLELTRIREVEIFFESIQTGQGDGVSVEVVEPVHAPEHGLERGNVRTCSKSAHAAGRK